MLVLLTFNHGYDIRYSGTKVGKIVRQLKGVDFQPWGFEDLNLWPKRGVATSLHIFANFNRKEV